jgi:hypothetical protein
MRVLENLIAAVTEQLQLLTTSREGAAGANGFDAAAETVPAGQSARMGE